MKKKVKKNERRRKMSSMKDEGIERETEELKEETREAEEAPEDETPQQEDQPTGDSDRKALEEANAKAAEYLAMAQRIQADFENFRRRNESVRADAYADGQKDVASLMLPVLDNLERAVEASADSRDEAIKSGIGMVLKQMNEVYQKLEVKPIDRLGERFDPNLENAILQGTPEEGEPGTVCQVLQKGYMIGDKVLRHAMVKVVPE